MRKVCPLGFGVCLQLVCTVVGKVVGILLGCLELVCGERFEVVSRRCCDVGKQQPTEKGREGI